MAKNTDDNASPKPKRGPGKPFAKGNAGRPVGSKNRRTAELVERIEATFPGFDPVVAMVELAQAKDLPVDLRLRALSEVAPYLHAKRRPAPDLQEETELAEAVAAARLRAVKSVGGLSLESLVVLSCVPEPDPSPQAFVPPLAAPPPSVPAPKYEPVPATQVSPELARAFRATVDDRSIGTALTDYDPFSTRN